MGHQAKRISVDPEELKKKFNRPVSILFFHRVINPATDLI